MQLDLRHFQLKVEGLTRLRPLPDAGLVETYIKAFYLPESALDEWVRHHTVSAMQHFPPCFHSCCNDDPSTGIPTSPFDDSAPVRQPSKQKDSAEFDGIDGRAGLNPALMAIPLSPNVFAFFSWCMLL